MRVQQRECAHDVLDRCDLGGVALQELQPRRHVGKEVSDLDRNTGQERPRALLGGLAGPDAEYRAAACTLDLRHRGDARQRLTAKTERLDGDEVGKLAQLAGRMADERDSKLRGRNAGAVVADSNRGLPRPAHVDADAPRARVEGVLDELLDDRSRSLDHLAGGDGVGHLRRKHLNHSPSLARSW